MALARCWMWSLPVALAAASGAACHRDEPELVGTFTAPDAAPPPPRDHLATGELLEGTEQAFGLVLPRGTKVDSVFPQQIIATNDANATDVANYVRARVTMGTVTVGAASTMFNRVQLAARPGRELVVRVEQGPAGTGSKITLRDVTPPPTDPNLSEEERWRRAGLKGPGQVADPTHLH